MVLLEFILIALLVIVVIAFIAYPLFAAPGKSTAPAIDALESLISQRDSAYEAIHDLDFDYQMGKLSQGDYEVLRDKYKARAELALQQIDELAGQVGADARIEEQVNQLRRHRTVPPAGNAAPAGDSSPIGDVVEQEVARLRARKGHGEGNASIAADVVEQEIARLRASKSRTASLPCPQCGQPYHAGDRFCSKCGAVLGVEDKSPAT
jgi:hypothetical protein